jgi:hypothetical protein
MKTQGNGYNSRLTCRLNNTHKQRKKDKVNIMRRIRIAQNIFKYWPKEMYEGAVMFCWNITVKQPREDVNNSACIDREANVCYVIDLCRNF